MRKTFSLFLFFLQKCLEQVPGHPWGAAERFQMIAFICLHPVVQCHRSIAQKCPAWYGKFLAIPWSEPAQVRRTSGSIGPQPSCDVLKQSFNKNLELGALCSVDFCPCFPTSKWVGILTFSIFLWLVERIGTTQRHEACQNPVSHWVAQYAVCLCVTVRVDLDWRKCQEEQLLCRARCSRWAKTKTVQAFVFDALHYTVPLVEILLAYLFWGSGANGWPSAEWKVTYQAFDPVICMKAGSDADAQDLQLPYGVEATQPQPAAINLCRALGAA